MFKRMIAHALVATMVIGRANAISVTEVPRQTDLYTLPVTPRAGDYQDS